MQKVIYHSLTFSSLVVALVYSLPVIMSESPKDYRPAYVAVAAVLLALFFAFKASRNPFQPISDNNEV